MFLRPQPFPTFNRRILLLLAFACSGGLLLRASESQSPVWEARSALADGLAPLAEKLAGERLADPETGTGEQTEALEVLLAALFAQGQTERLLKLLDSGTTVPSHDEAAIRESMTYWRARSLGALGRPAEAVAMLRNAQDDLPEPLQNRILVELPPALLATGQTNAALSAYEVLSGRPLEPATSARVALHHARLLDSASGQGEAEKILESLQEERRRQALPADPASTLQLAAWRLNRGDKEGAHALLGQLTSETIPPDVRATALIGLSEIAVWRTDWTTAAERLAEAAKLELPPPVGFEVHAASARLFLRRGHSQEAIGELRRALRLPVTGPGPLRLQLDIANGLLDRGNPESALPEYQSVIESTTDPGIETEAQRGRAESLSQTGRAAEAAVAYLRVADLTEDPDEQETCLYRAAESQRQAGLHAQAAETLSRFQTLFPDSTLAPRAGMLQGKALARVSPASAETHLMALTDRYPDTPEAARALFLAAQLAADREASPEAVSRYEQTIRHPQADAKLQASSHIGRGLIFFNGFHFERALNEFEQARTFGGLAAQQASYLHAATLYNLGMEQQSLQASLDFLRNHPDSPWAPDVTYWLGRYHFNRQQFEEAERYFLSLVETWPTRPECDGALLWVARARFALKRWADSSAAALQLIRDYPESLLLAEARLVHAESLCERMRFDEAILAFDELLAQHPESPWIPQALGRKGDSLFTLGTDNPARYKESIQAYEAMLNRPGLALDMQLQGAYKIGRCYEKWGDPGAALEQYYRGVLLRYAEARDSGMWPNDRANAWFARAALSAADLMEQRQNWSAAVAILQRMAREDVPGRAEAAERARRILQTHPGTARP